MEAHIESLFADFDSEGCLKEAERVFVLSPELLSHPSAHKSWELEQERNLAYVAVTRGKYDVAKGAVGTLIFVGPLLSIYSKDSD